MREAMRGVLPDAIRARSWKADFTAQVNLGVHADLAGIARALGPESRSVGGGYVAAAPLARQIADLGPTPSDAECLRSWQLADTFGLETWLRVFFSGPDSGNGGHDGEQEA
jgi:hypothetical protein